MAAAGMRNRSGHGVRPAAAPILALALAPTRRGLLAAAAGAALPGLAAAATRLRRLAAPPVVGRAAPDRPLVMLDPGHGGKDPGAIGVSGTYEKHVGGSGGVGAAAPVARLGPLPGSS